MRDYFHHYLLGFILWLMCALPGYTADTLTANALLDDLRRQVDAAEQTFAQNKDDVTQLEQLATASTHLAQQAQTCLSDYTQNQTQAQQAIESLGAASSDDLPDIKNKRKELEQSRQAAEKVLSQCRLFSLRINTLLEEISKSRQTLLHDQLLTPTHSILSHLEALLQPEVWKLDIINTANTLWQPEIAWLNLPIALLYGVGGLMLGLFWRKRARNTHQARQLALTTTSPTLGQAWRYGQQFMPYLLSLACVLIAFQLHPLGIPPLPDNDLLGLAHIVGGTLLALGLIRVLWLLSGRLAFLRYTRLYLLAVVALLVAIGSLWLGYRNFAHLLISGVTGSLVVLLTAWLLLQIPKEIFDGLDEGRAPWQQHIRQHLGLRANQFVPGMVWLRLTLALSITGISVLLLLRLWGMPEQYLTLLLNRLDSGFEIAGFKLEPLRIIGGLLVIALLISMTHVLKTHVAENWLQRTGLSRGAQETATTVSGYIGILLAILLGLSVAGIEFKNLAIIAGALSVGIGFGLQNIVNNFVSGLILLFERPIRKGDWIKVGNAEGYVRDISIRSTTIQAFDHSDIIVPNSEIISGQVTNMMLNDNVGRIIIPISVAYGSDSERVMHILQTVADAHPTVVKSDEAMRINVLCRGFGEDSLKFELRCFVTNIEARTGVTSDLNLAIDKAFRQDGIEIPASRLGLHRVAAASDNV